MHAFCESPNVILINRRCPQSSRPVRLTTRSRTPPRALALPPALALPLIALLSTSGKIPQTIRNAPTSFLVTSFLANTHLLRATTLAECILERAPAALALLLLTPSPTRASPTLFAAFLLGALGTAIGAFVAALLIPNPALAAAFAATYIGGSANFVAVAHALSLSTQYTVAAMSVDLGAMMLYFTALFLIATRIPHTERNTIQSTNTKLSPITLVTPIILTFLIVYMTNVLRLPATLNLLITTLLATCISSIPLIRPYLSQSTKLSTVALNLFFAALGANARFSSIISASPSVSIFAAIVLLVHAIVLYVVGALWLRIPTKELLLASNANIGGASTAAAFAACLGWRSLVHGAVAVGTLGYILGTPIGLLIFRVLSRGV